MEYTVFEISLRDGIESREKHAVFDSAYEALRFMLNSKYRGDDLSKRLHLIDSGGTTLLRPVDIIDEGFCSLSV